MTKIYALIGSTENVNKSWSPTIHNAWLKHYKINAEYIGFGHDGDYNDIINMLKNRGDVKGANVTTPFKQHLYGGNTLKFETECYSTDHHTDGYGFTKAFEPYLEDARKAEHVIILGDGCVARTIKNELSRIGIDAVMFPRHTVLLMEFSSKSKFPDNAFVIKALAKQTYYRGAAESLTVNYDRTTTVDSFPIQMLLHEAAKSFEIWHGFLPDIKIAEQAIKQAQDEAKHGFRDF